MWEGTENQKLLIAVITVIALRGTSSTRFYVYKSKLEKNSTRTSRSTWQQLIKNLWYGPARGNSPVTAWNSSYLRWWSFENIVGVASRVRWSIAVWCYKMDSSTTKLLLCSMKIGYGWHSTC